MTMISYQNQKTKQESTNTQKQHVMEKKEENHDEEVSPIDNDASMNNSHEQMQGPNAVQINQDINIVFYPDHPFKSCQDHTEWYHRFHCVFCGGKNCKYENWKQMPSNRGVAVFGLHSNFVTENLIASQRLSTRLMKEYNIIQQFRDKKIKSVINLQQRGEHPHCGDGIDKKIGFSYDPEKDLMNYKIRYYNFSWRDFAVPPDPSFVLPIMHIIQQDIESGGKVLIHCHAGRGRTGIIICCYLLYIRKFFDPMEAIRYCRSKREGSVQNSSQVQFVKQFHEYLIDKRRIFKNNSLRHHMSKQRELLHGTEYRILKNIPRIIFESAIQLSRILPQYDDILSLIKNFEKDIKSSELAQVKKELDMGLWRTVATINDPIFLFRLLFDWFHSFEVPIFDKADFDHVAPMTHDTLTNFLLEKGETIKANMIFLFGFSLSTVVEKCSDKALITRFFISFARHLCQDTALTQTDKFFLLFLRQMKKGKSLVPVEILNMMQQRLLY